MLMFIQDTKIVSLILPDKNFVAPLSLSISKNLESLVSFAKRVDTSAIRNTVFETKRLIISNGNASGNPKRYLSQNIFSLKKRNIE